MRKFFCTILFVFSITLMGCSSYELIENESIIHATVTKCEENMQLNYAYEQLALNADTHTMRKHYMQLALENATYTYTISVEIDGKTYKFVKPESVEVGGTIEVTKIETLYEGKVIDVEYK